MWCACGDEFVIQPEVQHVSVWRELGIVTLIAGAIMGVVLLAIQMMERMVLPW